MYIYIYFSFYLVYSYSWASSLSKIVLPLAEFLVYTKVRENDEMEVFIPLADTSAFFITIHPLADWPSSNQSSIHINKRNTTSQQARAEITTCLYSLTLQFTLLYFYIAGSQLLMSKDWCYYFFLQNKITFSSLELFTGVNNPPEYLRRRWSFPKERRVRTPDSGSGHTPPRG